MLIKTSGYEIDTDLLIDVDSLTPNITLCGIYIIYNLINNKIYIGQAKNIRRRWYGHCQKWAHQTVIDKAIKKYGKHAFKCFVLESFNYNLKKLNSQEKYWSYLYKDCYVPSGYNVETCGKNSKNLLKMYKVSCYDAKGLLVNTFESITEATDIMHIHNIAKVAKTLYNKAGGFYWRFGDIQKIDVSNLKKLKTGPNGGKIIYQYNKKGMLINQFNSTCDAARELGNLKYATNIQSCAANKIRSAYNFYWSYDKFDNIFTACPYLNESSQKYKWKKVGQYSTDGVLIKIFNNQLEAAKTVGVGAGSICSAIKGKQHTCKGYVWKEIID